MTHSNETTATALSALQARLGHAFADVALLATALCHASFVNEQNSGQQTYERLEFVGDAVLGLLCAELLFCGMPDAPEGELSLRRARVVRRKTLAALADDLNLATFVRVGAGHQGGADRIGESILADVYEAVMGAVYIDAGFGAVRHCFGAQIGRAIEKTQLPQDFKTRLQEHAHTLGLGAPAYIVEEVTGPAHERRFSCAVRLGQTVYGRGVGTSKKTAEQICAQSALLALGIGRDDP